MTEIYEWLNVAEDLAPTPTGPEAPREDWARHFAALALAAHAAFRDQLPRIPTGPREPGRGSMPELGYLMHIASGAKAAAVALLTPADEVSALIWDLTLEQGSLNGEDVDWLADTVARLGINPAHIYPWYAEADFAPVVKRESQPGPTCRHCGLSIVPCPAHGEGRDGWIHLTGGGHKCAGKLTEAEPGDPKEAAGTSHA